MKRWKMMLAVLATVSAFLMVGPFATVTGAIPVPHGTSPGYWLLTGYGSTYAYGAPYFGAQLNMVTQSPCQGNDGYTGRNLPTCNGISATPSGRGYWVEDGFGAIPEGDTGSCTFAAGPPVTPDGAGAGIAAAPTGAWLAATDGGVFALCGATFYGSMGGMALDKPIVGIAATPDGKGYWLVASDGGIFAFGDAVFYGSMGGSPLNRPVVGIAATPDGKGYWLVASDGGIFAFGDAAFSGSMGGKSLAAPIVGITANLDGTGYWTAAADGGVFAFGDAPFLGSAAGNAPDAPIVGIASKA